MRSVSRALAMVLLAALAVPAGAEVTRCNPITKDHSVEAHAAPTGHKRLCRMDSDGSVEVSKVGGLGQMDVHDNYAAIVQRDEGMVALVDLFGMRVVGRYQDEVDQSLDGDVAFSNDGEWLFYARQTSNFDEDGVHVLNVSNKEEPTLTMYHPAGGAFRIEYFKDDAGEWVVLLDAIDGLVVYRFVREAGTIVKVFQDAAPALKVGGPASAGLFVSPKDPATGQALLYVTTGRTGLQVYDFSNPAAPEIIGEWSNVGLADVDVLATKRKRKVYAATEYWFDKNLPPKVIVLNATNLEAIEKTGIRKLRVPADDLWRVQGIDLYSTNLYAAHSHAGLIEWHGRRVTGVASLPAAHNEAAGYNASPYAMDVVHSGFWVLVTDASSGRLFRLFSDHEFISPRGG